MCLRKYSKKARLKAVLDYVEQVRTEIRSKELSGVDELRDEVVAELLTIENNIRKEC